MCGRMTLTRSGGEIAAYFAEAMAELMSAETLEEVARGAPKARFNITPSQEVLTVVPAPAGSGALAEFAWKQWGLVPSWAKDPAMGQRMFNARSETVAEKPSFRAAFKRRRCLVVADGFYEWTPRNKGHRPYLFQSSDAPILQFAGLFEEWQGEGGEVIESCTVLTTDANADLAEVHHRMPVLLTAQSAPAWLDAAATANELAPLMRPSPAGTLTRQPVTRYVNDPRHNDARCMEPEPPIARAEQGALFALDGGEAPAKAEQEEEF